MAQAFDTGLSLAQRTILRNAVVAALEPLQKSEGGYLASVRPVSCVVLGKQDVEGVAELYQQMDAGSPMVGIALGKGTGEGTGMAGPHYQKNVEVHVYALSANARGFLARMAQDAGSLASDTFDPGIETILEHVDELIEGLQIKDTPAFTIKGLDFLDEDELWHEGDRTIWRARYEVKVERNRKRGKGVTQQLVDMRAKLLEAHAATSSEDPLTVATWTAGTLVLTFTSARPAELAIGDRLTLVAAADGSEQLVTVADLVSTDGVELAVAPDAAPEAGDLAYRTQNPIVDLVSTL